jgi:hypothetical protein
MTRAKTAAREAGARAQRSPSFAAALAAERDGLRSYQRKRMADAAAKFYEATGLFRSAELSSAEAAPARTEAPRGEPAAPSQAPSVAAPPAAPSPPPAAASPSPSAATPVSPQPDPPVPVPAPAPVTTPPIAPIARTPPASLPPADTAKTPEDGIRDLVRRYEQALEARSVEALKRLWPSLQGAQEEAIRQEFSHARRIDVEITSPDITVSGNAAAVTFLRRYQLSTVDGQRLLTSSRTTLNARRNGDDWIIERVRFEAMK